MRSEGKGYVEESRHGHGAGGGADRPMRVDVLDPEPPDVRQNGHRFGEMAEAPQPVPEALMRAVNDDVDEYAQVCVRCLREGSTMSRHQLPKRHREDIRRREGERSGFCGDFRLL